VVFLFLKEGESMKISRYTATGNSFVICDVVGEELKDEEKSQIVVKNVKDRDGAIFIEKHDDFFMDYFNRDGKRAEFCGNGARTFVKYLYDKGYVKNQSVTFDSFSGKIEGKTVGEEIMIKMPEVKIDPSKTGSIPGFYISVGVPHYVIFVEDVNDVDVKRSGATLRWELDANIDFVEIVEIGSIKMRTYERGVEGETKACGTGATASAFIVNSIKRWNKKMVQVHVPGGELKVFLNEKALYLQGGVSDV
jgi:diaminopimelate epimerase